MDFHRGTCLILSLSTPSLLSQASCHFFVKLSKILLHSVKHSPSSNAVAGAAGAARHIPRETDARPIAASLTAVPRE
jgi:hypothetical protein